MVGKALIALIGLLCAAPAWAAPAIFVNGWQNTVGSGNGHVLAVDTSTGAQAQVGDVEVAGFSYFNETVSAAPSGWNVLVGPWAFSTTKAVLYCKVVAAADIGANPQWTWTGTNAYVAGGIVDFRNVNPTCTPDVAGAGSTGNSTLLTAASITLVANGDAVIWYGSSSNSFAAPGGGFSLGFGVDKTTGSFTSRMQQRVGAVPGATGSVASGAQTSTFWAAVMVGFAPNPGLLGTVTPGD